MLKKSEIKFYNPSLKKVSSLFNREEITNPNISSEKSIFRYK